MRKKPHKAIRPSGRVDHRRRFNHILAATIVGLSFLLIGPLWAIEQEATKPLASPQTLERFTEGVSPLEQRLVADAADGRLDEHSLIRAALVASGVGREKALADYLRRYDKLVERLRHTSSVTSADTPQARAEAVFEFLHTRLLRGQYHLNCTDVREALDNGRYNCVSASVLFNCMADAVGLEVCGLEIPGHAMSRLLIGDTSLDIETTCPDWFRLKHDPDRRAAAVENTLGATAVTGRREVRAVSPVQLVAMIYYNRGVDLLAEKRFAEAASANAKALQLDPQSTAAWGNLLATINNWAIAQGNAQRFAEASDLLRQALALEPEYQSFTTNYIHVHHQWVEHLCQAAQFEEALDVLAAAQTEQPELPFFRQASIDVYRRWARSVFDREELDQGFAILDAAAARHGACPEIVQMEEAVINDYGLAQLEAGRFESAIRVFDGGLQRMADSELLAGNRRVAVMRWAEPAFAQGDYAEAIRRTTQGAMAGHLHPSLQNNVRYGYQRWTAQLRAEGHGAQAEQIQQRTESDPFLRP
ncbi:MAG TPA: hypothetical protein VE890_08250 [Thermoguttaceae bacterium]|nr:hypothetical protein [Thermoguttaceae bacterium]